MSYGEGVSSGCATDFGIMRPTIELPLDELLEVQEAEEWMVEAYACASLICGNRARYRSNDDIIRLPDSCIY
jgi:hypothetical protein